MSVALKYARANSGLTFRPDANTVLWFPGQDDNFSSTVRDRSGSGNDGTIFGATWARTGQGLWYLTFDGADDWIDLGTPATLNTGLANAFSVDIWCRKTATGLMILWSIGDKASVILECGIIVGGDSLPVVRAVLATVNTDTTPKHANILNTWEMHTVDYDGTTLRHRVNGVQIGEIALAAPMDNNAAWTFGVGGYGGADPDWYWQGDIGGVRVRNVSVPIAKTLYEFQQEQHLYGV